jgi:hypothetical protein
MSGRWQRWSAIAGAALLIGAAGGTAAVAKSFSLAITGAQGASYSGHCILTTVAGEERFELTGVVPRHEELTGEGLACRIEAVGLVAVEIAHSGDISRLVTSGGSLNIAVR